MKKEAPKKKRVTEQDCRLAELLLKSNAPMKEIAALVGKDQTTINRMKRAGFDLETYNRITKDRRMKFAKEPEEPEKAPEIEGQMEMDLTTVKPEAAMSEQVKMMRFQAAQVDKVIMKLDQIYNMTSMILRAIRGE